MNRRKRWVVAGLCGICVMGWVTADAGAAEGETNTAPSVAADATNAPSPNAADVGITNAAVEPEGPAVEGKPAETETPVIPAETALISAFDTFLKRVEIGTRATLYVLHDDKRSVGNEFYGTINELDASQNYWPIKLFAAVRVNPYWGFELTWDQIQADAYAHETVQYPRHRDGEIRMMGPIGSVFVRYPNESRFMPYGGAGLARMQTSFDEDQGWATGYGGGSRQTISLDTATGWVIYGGCAYRISEHWQADIMLRHMEVDVDGTHYHNVIRPRPVDFPMGNNAFGLGVRYCF